MAAFPRLRTGAISQYPAGLLLQAPVTILRYIDGTEQRFRTVRAPVRRWTVRLAEVSEEELACVQAFFSSQQGRTGSFEFTDPWSGALYPDCSFESDELQGSVMGEDRASTTITIRSNQS